MISHWICPDLHGTTRVQALLMGSCPVGSTNHHPWSSSPLVDPDQLVSSLFEPKGTKYEHNGTTEYGLPAKVERHIYFFANILNKK